ncbi:MAG: hypothetical protein V3S08_09355, partial [Phycisphaerales bacterium]
VGMQRCLPPCTMWGSMWCRRCRGEVRCERVGTDGLDIAGESLADSIGQPGRGGRTVGQGCRNPLLEIVLEPDKCAVLRVVPEFRFDGRRFG